MNKKQIHVLGRLAYYGNKILTFLTILILLVGSLYCFYCLFDDWRQEQGGLPSQMAKFKPDVEDPLSFDELLKINPDVIGWITIDDTHIDQPVVQGKDDMEYINKGADGSYTLAGAIFLSSLDKPDFSDPYNLLYGHHMDNHGMFGDVTEFLDQKYFDRHVTGTLLTKEFEEYDLRVFAVVSADASDPNVFSMSLASNGTTDSLIAWVKEHAVHWREPENASPKVFALSTCNNANTNERTIVYAEAVRVVDHADNQ